MSSTTDRTPTEGKIRAERLLKDLRSEDPERQMDAARRLSLLPHNEERTEREVLATRDEVKRKHALNLIAYEWGYDSWPDFVAAFNAPEPTAPVPGAVLERWAFAAWELAHPERCRRGDTLWAHIYPTDDEGLVLEGHAAFYDRAGRLLNAADLPELARILAVDEESFGHQPYGEGHHDETAGWYNVWVDSEGRLIEFEGERPEVPEAGHTAVTLLPANATEDSQDTPRVFTAPTRDAALRDAAEHVTDDMWRGEYDEIADWMTEQWEDGRYAAVLLTYMRLTEALGIPMVVNLRDSEIAEATPIVAEVEKQISAVEPR